ncbi:hypothetical protein HPB50_001109 [Hyalomma asiaticum]|uniref:Uncharacterized protein n=1 Tax=Hyalomma asiaticum TaxID=266040 RepID=A0ACB7RXM4_HYAAI|nr:hypothetical protein HPB50_001109 [Hyalomma asiaticum]
MDYAPGLDSATLTLPLDCAGPDASSVIMPVLIPSSTTSCHVVYSQAIRRTSGQPVTSGLGDSTSGNMLRNRLCFVIQASGYLPASCHRSDNRFLVLLPCPKCVKWFLNCVLPANDDLLSCGDIAANRGPSDRDMSEVLKGQKIISSTVEAIQSAQKEMEDKLTRITGRIDGIDVQLQKLNTLTINVQNMESTVSKLESQDYFKFHIQ